MTDTDTTKNLKHWLNLAVGAADTIRETCAVIDTEFGIDVPGIDRIVTGADVIAAAGQAALRGEPPQVPVTRQDVFTATATLRQQLAGLDKAMMKVCGRDLTGSTLGGFVMEAADVIRISLDRLDAAVPALWPETEVAN